LLRKVHHQIVDQALQGGQITHHAGAGIDAAAHGDIQQIVVAMAMGPGALAVNRLVFSLAELGPGQTVGSGEVGADREEGFHRGSGLG
jgi:hypothetical protein